MWTVASVQQLIPCNKGVWSLHPLSHDLDVMILVCEFYYRLGLFTASGNWNPDLQFMSD